MLKTMSAEERARSYYLQNPRECDEFTREAARKIKPGKNMQVSMHAGGKGYEREGRSDG